MGVDVVTSVVIDRPRDEVATFASNPANATKWYKNILSVNPLFEGDVGVGSRVEFVARFLGRRLAYTYEVRELVPGERFVMSTAQGPFPMETIYSWEDVSPAATKMSLRNRGNPAGFSRIVAPIMGGAMRRANRQDLARLRILLEATRGE